MEITKEPYTSNRLITSNGSVLLKSSNANEKILQKSVDGGANWIDLYTFTTSTILRFAIILDNGNILAATDMGDGLTAPTGYVWLSTDDGTTFSTVIEHTSGESNQWSFAHSGSVVYCGEYGLYPSTKVYKSTDSGATWSVIFTHPNDADGLCHIHRVCLDPYDNQNLIITSGDGQFSGNSNVWFSQDAGVSFTKVLTQTQITEVVFTQDHVLLFTDESNGRIYRDTKQNFKSNTVTKNVVWDGVGVGAEKDAEFYGVTVDSYGRIYASTVDEGKAELSTPALIISDDDGETWTINETIAKVADESHGYRYLSKPLVYNGVEYIFASEVYNPKKLIVQKQFSELTIKAS